MILAALFLLFQTNLSLTCAVQDGRVRHKVNVVGGVASGQELGYLRDGLDLGEI